jgi:hypothetical protein
LTYELLSSNYRRTPWVIWLKQSCERKVSSPFAKSIQCMNLLTFINKTYTMCGFVKTKPRNCMLIQFQVSWSFPFFSGLKKLFFTCNNKLYCLLLHPKKLTV